MPLTPDQKKELEAKIYEYVGRPIGPPFVARDPVNEPQIRAWCDATGDQLPVYWDDAAGKESVHGGVVAPPTMLQAWTMQGFEMHKGYDEPQNEEHRLHKLLTEHGYSGVLGTDTEQEYLRYVKPGDVITANTIFDSISEEKATGAGVGYFITTRTTFTDQNDEEVGWMTFRVLKFIPAQAPQAAADSGGSAAPAAPTRIKPPMGHDNGWWWEKASEGKFVIQRCTECEGLRHPPRPVCDKCASTKWDSIEASGRGTIHTFTIIHHPQFPGYDFPIFAALIDLEEGTRIVSNVVDCDPAKAEIGMKVQAFIHEDEDGFKLPLFRPAS